jgi:hypothetical protein
VALGVDFINILPVQFLYEILAPKITNLSEFFWGQYIGKKRASNVDEIDTWLSQVSGALGQG